MAIDRLLLLYQQSPPRALSGPRAQKRTPPRALSSRVPRASLALQRHLCLHRLRRVPNWIILALILGRRVLKRINPAHTLAHLAQLLPTTAVWSVSSPLPTSGGRGRERARGHRPRCLQRPPHLSAHCLSHPALPLHIVRPRRAATSRASPQTRPSRGVRRGIARSSQLIHDSAATLSRRVSSWNVLSTAQSHHPQIEI